jgi:hypothetical protein
MLDELRLYRRARPTGDAYGSRSYARGYRLAVRRRSVSRYGQVVSSQ